MGLRNGRQDRRSKAARKDSYACGGGQAVDHFWSFTLYCATAAMVKPVVDDGSARRISRFYLGKHILLLALSFALTVCGWADTPTVTPTSTLIPSSASAFNVIVIGGGGGGGTSGGFGGAPGSTSNETINFLSTNTSYA